MSKGEAKDVEIYGLLRDEWRGGANATAAEAAGAARQSAAAKPAP